MKHKLLALLVVLTVLASFLPLLVRPTPAYASSITVYAYADTVINENVPDYNYGTWPYMGIGAVSTPIASTKTRALLEFLPELPAGASVVSAYLQLYYYDRGSVNPAGDVYYAQRLLRSNLTDPTNQWMELQATWHRYRIGFNWAVEGASQLSLDYSSVNQASVAVTASYGWLTWDVTSLVMWAEANNEGVSLRIVSSVESEHRTIFCYSKECADAAYQPRLIVNYNIAIAPTVATAGAANISAGSANCYGSIVDVGSANATRRGIKYGLTQTDTWDSFDTGTFGTGGYNRTLTGLSPDTTYYYRAYATNAYGTGYGTWESFITTTGVPVVTTDTAYTYGYGSCFYATMSGTITNTGNTTVTRRGFEWGLNPVSASNDEYETGSFSTGSYNLTAYTGANLTYWFRAYATNAGGTGYGMWKPFWTPEGLPTDCSGGGGANYTGSGTPGDPYVIWNAYGLQAIESHKGSYWELGCNINATETATWNGGQGFAPISDFWGALDGNGHSISGLYVARSGGNYGLTGGLFGGNSGGYIHNLVMSDVSITITTSGTSAPANVGALVGYMTGGTITCVYVQGNVTGICTDTSSPGSNCNVGGLIGALTTGTVVSVSQCAADVKVVASALQYAYSYAGGLVGNYLNTAGAGIVNCYARGNVTATKALRSAYAGGLIGVHGTASASGIIDRCYSTGLVSAQTDGGGLTGRVQSTPATTRSYWDTQTSGWLTSYGGTGKLTVEMKAQETFVDWDFVSVWGIDPLVNSGYPYFQCLSEGPPEDATMYILTLDSSDNGDVTTPGEGSFNYTYGEVVNIIATPYEGYRFALWVGNVSEVANVRNSSTTVTMVDNYNITALFVASDKLALYITSNDGGSVVDPGEGLFSYDYDTDVELEASAATNYSFFAWTGDTDTIADVHDATTSIDMLDDYAITANFVGGSNYVLVVYSTSGGEVLTPGEGTFEYAPSTVVDLVAWADPGGSFEEWTGDIGTIVDVYSATTTITMNDNYVILANFTAGNSFTLTLDSTAGGNVTTPGEGAFVYASGTVVNIVATADGNYTFAHWTGNVGTVADTTDSSTTITMNGDYDLIAEFVPDVVTLCSLTTSSGVGGSVVLPGEGVYTYPLGTVVQLTATADSGYWFREWTGNIEGIANPLSFNTTVNMNGNYVVAANFEEELGPEPGAPNVTTGNATSVMAMSATLRGELTSMGNYTPVYVFFQYGLNTSYGTNTPQSPRTSVGNFSRSVSNLLPNTTYHFRAVAEYNSYVYGNDTEFTTTSGGATNETPGQEYQHCGDTHQYESYATGDNDTAIVYGANWFFQTFTVNESFKIEWVRLKAFRNGTPGVLTVSVRDVDDLGRPTGVDLTSATFDGLGPSVGWYEIEVPTYRLETDQYAIVVRAVAGDTDNYVGWQFNGTGNFTGGTYGASSDSGVSWSTDANSDFMFETYGSTVLCILDVKVFSGYLNDGDWLIAIHYLNEFPPYYGKATAADYFNLQLVANGNIAASVGMLQWGDMPGAIYLAKNLSDTLEWGSTYTVRLRGTFDPYPSATYVLVPSDWRGNDLTRLDDWVFEVSNEMGTYYDVALTTYSNNVLVLNDAGSALFATGIPMLAAVRSGIFLNPAMYIPYTEKDWQRTYQESLRLQELLGSKIVTDAETVGYIFGMTGQQIAQFGLFGGWLLSSIGIASVAGGAGFIVTLPLLFIALLWGVIPLAAIAVLGAIFVFVLIWYFWLSRVG